MATPYQTGLAVALPTVSNQQATLQLSPTGDLQLTEGENKLLTQMVRALVNDDVFANVVNSRGSADRIINTLVNLIYESFRNVQIDYVEKSDPDLTGFAIYRKAAASDGAYAKISGNGVVYNFVDTELFNHTEYLYGISKVYKGTFESKFVEILSATPSPTPANYTPVIGNDAFLLPGNKQVTIYVDFIKRHKASELLELVEFIDVVQDKTDPRKYLIVITVRTYLGNQLNVSSILSLPSSI